MLHGLLRGSPYVGRWRQRRDEIEREVLEKVRRRERVARNVHAEHTESLTFGQRLSDSLASVAGSWSFISAFLLMLGTWIALNTFALIHHWDKYPYILLNLILSMLAAVQAPVIMMSQNRQEARDRLHAEHDYEINLKAEIEIQQLHQKLDELRETQWNGLIDLQRQQISLLEAQLDILRKRG